jgi:hypothetical protein
MYNGILVDHFNGKRAADDPEVRLQFRWIKEQAQIHWEKVYGDNSVARLKVTPENIEEDYINNARLTAKIQRGMKKFMRVVLVILVAVLVYLVMNR